MSTTTASLNGKAPRKQLGDQLDRLDTIIDALADGLPAAVADACKEGARAAVKDAVIEILTNPELRELIAKIAPVAAVNANATQPHAIPAEPTRPGLWARMKAKIQSAQDAIMGWCRIAKQRCITRFWRIKQAIVALTSTLSLMVPTRQILIVGLGLGAMIGVISFICPHWISAILSGVTGACTCVAAQVVMGFLRMTHLFGFATE